jgi:lipoprotein-anchoring transpeptidase ErfK/SrfK
VPLSCVIQRVNLPVSAKVYKRVMMDKRILTIFAVAAVGAAGSSPVAAQSYSQPYPQQQTAPGYPAAAPGSYPPPSAYDRGPPDFDALDDDAPNAPGSTALSTPGLPANSAPLGPVMSPDDPRYGRPAGPPPVIYSERPAPGGNFIDPSDDRPLRPPGTISPQGAPGAMPPVGAAPQPGPDGRPATVMTLPADEQPETGPRKELPERLRRQEVSYATKEPAGTIIVDTPNTQLYYILGNGRAVRYGVRVGRDGFTWTGVQKITRKAEWPDWHPPPEMIERQPYLPRFMAGGDGNPLGARAMYLGATVYRIHGTNQPSTIGQFVSSGCIGMLNEDVTDLFDRAKVGTRVVVLPGGKPPLTASSQPAPGQYQGQYPGPNAGPAPNSSAPMSSGMSSGMAPAPMTSGQASANVPGAGPTVVPPLPAPVTIR